MKQLHVFFSGQVQGVGFRYETQQVARSLPVSGWVRNCRDGRVEMLAQGEQAVLEELLTQLRSGRLGRNIEGVECNWSDNEKALSEFEVRATV